MTSNVIPGGIRRTNTNGVIRDSDFKTYFLFLIFVNKNSIKIANIIELIANIRIFNP